MILDFSARLKFFRSRADLTQGELAKAVGISQKQVSDYEVGSAKPRQATYFKILDALNMTDEEFCGNQISTQNDSPLILKIPVLNWVNLPANTSGFIESDSYIYVDSQVLKRTSTIDLFAMQVGGMLMYPAYKDGDYIIIDSSKKTISNGGAYIILINNEPTIKLCYWQLHNKLRLVSLNSDFANFDNVSPDDITIVGEVIFKMGFA